MRPFIFAQLPFYIQPPQILFYSAFQPAWHPKIPVPLTPQFIRSGGGIYVPICSTCFLNPPDSQPQTASWSVQPFLHSSRQWVPIHYNGPPFLPLKIAPFHEGSGPHLIQDSLGQSKLTTQMASRSVQQFLHLTTVRDRPTDHAT